MNTAVNGRRTQNLKDYLRAVSKLCGGRQCNFESFVLKHGQPWPSAPLPQGLRRGRMKECFRNAALAALDDPSLIYVEGFAVSMIPFLHAWCVTPSGRVAEVTWPEPGTEYFGIPFATDYLSRAVFQAGYYGLLDCWKLKWPIVRGTHPPAAWLHPKYKP